jgi:hypothetical protein
LSNVFKYLGLADLLKVRLVNCSWNAESSLYIGSRKIICINKKETLGSLAELIHANPAQPFRSFEFWSFRIDLDCDETLPYISTCSPYIQNLTLNFNKDSGRDLINLRCLRDLLLYYLPNLKSLIIRQLPFEIMSHDWIFPPEGETKFIHPILPSLKSLVIYSDGDYNENFLRNLLECTSSLEEITVEYGDEPMDFKFRFFSAIFSCYANLRNLRSLQYFMHDPGAGPEWAWTSEDCEELAQMNLVLSTIKLHPGRDCKTKSTFHLLESLSATLETLKLRVHDQLLCPNMNYLKEVTLYDYEGSLTFLDQMPNLRLLGLCEYSPARYLTPDNIISKKTHPLLSLNLYGSSGIPTHLFNSMISALPNLKLLNFWHMTNKKLRLVMEKLQKLEELIMNVVNIDDEVITGLPIDLCEQMERSGNYSDYISQEDQLRKGPHIGYLKSRLQYLMVVFLEQSCNLI